MNNANYQRAETAIAPPQHPIPSALSQLGTSIHEMGILSDMLAGRLGVVLMPTQPQPTGKGETLAAAPPPISAFADEVHGYRRRVENITAQLQDVLNRLEV
jgi:hypothetical protein